MSVTKFYPRLLLNSQKLAAILGLAAAVSIVLFYVVPEAVSVLISGALLVVMLAIQERRRMKFFKGFIFPALLIWISSFVFFLAKSSYPNVMPVVLGSLGLLIAALTFGFYRIATVSPSSAERA